MASTLLGRQYREGMGRRQAHRLLCSLYKVQERMLDLPAFLGYQQK